MRFTNFLRALVLLIVLLGVMIWTIFMCHKLVKENSMLPETPFEVINVTVTAYSPSKAQTSGDNPFEMASGLIAMPNDLWKLKYVAVSRDLKERFKLDWNDSIFIEFQIQDTMAKKITNTIDVFTRNLQIARAFGKQKRKIIILKED